MSAEKRETNSPATVCVGAVTVKAVLQPNGSILPHVELENLTVLEALGILNMVTLTLGDAAWDTALENEKEQ